MAGGGPAAGGRWQATSLGRPKAGPSLERNPSNPFQEPLEVQQKLALGLSEEAQCSVGANLNGASRGSVLLNCPSGRHVSSSIGSLISLLTWLSTYMQSLQYPRFSTAATMQAPCRPRSIPPKESEGASGRRVGYEQTELTRSPLRRPPASPGPAGPRQPAQEGRGLDPESAKHPLRTSRRPGGASSPPRPAGCWPHPGPTGCCTAGRTRAAAWAECAGRGPRSVCVRARVCVRAPCVRA